MRDTKAWTSVHEIRQANKAAGFYFFSPDTMAFFKSRIVTEVLHERYFVTSEIGPTGSKAYTVRVVHDNADIETVGLFHSHKTLQIARRWLDGYVVGIEEKKQ